MHNQKIKYKYDQKKSLVLLVRQAALHSHAAILSDFELTEQKINHVFNDYNGKITHRKHKFAFVIPTRATRKAADYWEEVYELFPALRHMSHHDAFSILALMPPMRVTSYGRNEESSQGVVIFAPIYTDMIKDYRLKIALGLSVTRRINDAVNFAYNRYGASYIGLGATLPKLTNYGRSISAPVITTTGHGGTAWLLTQIFAKVIDDYFCSVEYTNLKVGFIGGGAIGLASMQAIARLYPGVQITTFDIRSKVNIRNKKKLQTIGVDIEIAPSNAELIENSDIIVSAITSTIDVSSKNLSGKVIIDDSQPGSFSREQVAASGGRLIWVVGADNSSKRILTRMEDYRYGPHGLASGSDVWGCEAEVAAIALSGKDELALNREVEFDDIQKIGKLLKDNKIFPAPYQSHGTFNVG